ncbi:MAG: adenylate/guanylate cyclase domain-containing protein [Ignavibacteriaceae bacterium]
MPSKINILIAEDESIIAKDIAQTLKKLGYNVLAVVRSGEDGFEYAKKLNPDLVLLDIMLEGEMTGIEAAEKIKNHLDIPFIFLTALADEETLHRAKVTEPFGYIIKPFDERALHTSIEMALYKHQINFKLKQRTQELEEERVKSNKLLHNILPADIINELREKGIIEPREFKMVTLLFTDFQGFTTLSSQMPPDKLVEELNDIFKNFDGITDKYGLEKLKTIGDSYMAAGGLPRESDDHAVRVVLAAGEMQDYIKKRSSSSEFKWIMRAGIHSGNVIAGVVGTHKYTYDVWGDTVNIASRMERHCEPGKINVTSVTHELIKDFFDCEYRGKAEVAKTVTVDMYQVIKQKENAPDFRTKKSLQI